MYKTITLLPSAARTATPTDATLSVDNADHIPRDELLHVVAAHIIIDVTAITATPSVTVTIQNYDSVSATYYNVLSSPAITATGKTVLKIGLSIATAQNGAARDLLSDKWKVVPTHADTDSITYSIGASIVYGR